MKKSLSLIAAICLGIVFSSYSQTQINLSAVKNDFKLSQKSALKFKVTSSLSSINLLNVLTARGNFFEMNIDGYTKIYNIGKPQLPVLSKLIEIPMNAQVQINIISYDEEIINLNNYDIPGKLMPCQISYTKSSDPASRVFSYDQSFYQQNAFNSDPLVRVETAGIMRGVQIGNLYIAPFRYNPVQNILKVYNNIEFEVVFNNADLALTDQMKQKFYSPYFESSFGTIVNYRDPAAKDVITKYPVKFVIISLTSFQATLQPLAYWKRQKGFTVIEKYYASAPTAATVKTYVQGLYAAGTSTDPAPTFVLLVGDIAQIPTNAATTFSGATDLYYCTMDGTSDYQPDIYYGRFSATTVAELQPQVDKTLEYEKYLMPNPSYLDTVVMIAGVDDGSQADGGFSQVWGNGQINYGTNNYFNPAHGIYSYTYLWPATNNAATDVLIRTNIGRGVGYTNYTAHGSATSWADPTFTVAQVASMNNLHKYGLMIGNCCVTNQFDYSSPCFGETLLRAVGKGAVGYIGASYNSLWDEDYQWGVGVRSSIIENPTYSATQLGAYDGMFHDHGEAKTKWFYTNGQMVHAGCLAVQASTSSYKKYYWEEYHLMGDPSVMTYFSVPDALPVAYTNPQTVGVTTLAVTTIEDAYVAISHNGVLLNAQLAPAGGVVTLTFPAFTSQDTADIVVTKQNRAPYIGKVYFLQPSSPYDASVAQVLTPKTSYNCEMNITPKVVIRNMGTTTLTSVNILSKVVGGTPQTQTWNGSLASMQSDTVDLQQISLATGSHVFLVYTNMPNGHADQNFVNDTMKISYTVNNLPLSSNFSINQNQNCAVPADFTFTNSSQNALSYFWNFGDGATSTDASPTHQYTQLGQYIITLTSDADVCGFANHTDTVTVGNTPPIANDVSHCGPGAVTLTATGSSTLNWYDAITGGNLLQAGGATYTTPILNNTTTYFVENGETFPQKLGGKADKSGTAANLTNQNQYLIFDCFTPVTLVSIDVYTANAGNRTFELRNSAGTVLQSATVNVTSTNANVAFTVPLNFSIPVGTNLQLGLSSSSTCNLYRNGETSNLPYPYTTAGVVSITTSSASTTPLRYYYYMYNWKLQQPSCVSAREAVDAIINTNVPAAGFTNSLSIYTATFTNTSTNGVSYLWDFGDGTTSTEANPVHVYPGDGTYHVVLTTTNECGSVTAEKDIVILTTGIAEAAKDGFEIYPNPTKSVLNININNADVSKIELVDNIGKLIFVSEKVNKTNKIEMSRFADGVYFIRLYTSEKTVTYKISKVN
jgi:PKD repeat protein